MHHHHTPAPIPTSREEALDAAGIIPMNATQLDDLRTEARILSATDADFRRELVADPRGTLAGLVTHNSLGLYGLSANLHIKVLEDTADKVHIVIPSADKAEVSNSEVATIAALVAQNPSLADELKVAPRETLARLLSEITGESVELPTDVTIAVVFEEAGELAIAVPHSASAGAVALNELGSDEKLDLAATYSCHTCTCDSAHQLCCFGSTPPPPIPHITMMVRCLN